MKYSSVLIAIRAFLRWLLQAIAFPKRAFRLSAALFAVLCVLGVPKLRANVALATPFTDNMVLQREMPVPVWGTAAVGESVTVEFAGQTKSTVADSAGKWLVTLDPLTTSAVPLVFTARGANTVTRSNVLVGEVWLCSGQSNVEGSMQRFENTTFGSNPTLAETKAIYDPELATTTPGVRLFRAGTVSSDTRKNIWMICGPAALTNASVMGFSAVGYFLAKGLHATNGLAPDQSVPIGIMESAVGGTTIETWTPPSGGNYTAMIQPIARFALRGVVWYQGESNVADDEMHYDDKVETLIQGWRSAWNQPVMPFMLVQLPRLSYVGYSPDSVTSSQTLAWFRDQQNRALRVPDTGIIITTDLVDTTDEIHPPNKWDVGQRLAMLALAKNYGQTNLVCSGPVYKSMEIRGNKLILSFDHIGRGLVSSGLKDFTAAGSDQHFYPATAVIEGDTVVVSSYAWAPVAVRYGWTELTMASLFNQEGLPAGPFRTDNWPQPALGPIVKANNSDGLNLASSWVGGAVPHATDVVLWDNTIATSASTVALGTDTSWGGIQITSPKGSVAIQPGNTLTLGKFGIDMSAAKTNLTISSGLTLGSASGQTWIIASGRTLKLNTGLFTRGAGATLNVQGSGIVTVANNLANDATGIIGPWLSFGTGAATKYATLSGGNVAGYTGTTAATAADVVDTAGKTNYSVAAGGTLGAGAAFNTLRYTGASGAVYGDCSANGLLNSGSGTLTMKGVVAIGASRELVINTANSDITLSSNLVDSSAGPSTLVKQGANTLTLSRANSYSAGSWINEGEIYYVASGGLGLGDVTVASGAKITFRPGGTTMANNVTLAGSAMNLSGASPVLNGSLSLSADARISTGNTANQNLTVNGPVNLGAFTLTLSTASIASQAWSIKGNISGTGGLLLASGTSTTTTLSLSGSNTFSGIASVTGSGALVLKNVNALKNSTLDTGGKGAQQITFGLTGANTYNLGGLRGADNLDLGANTLSIGGNNENTVYIGVLSGTGGAVTKVGAGTLILAGANTFSGGTTISNGTLALSGDGSLASASIINNGRFDVSDVTGGYHLLAGKMLQGTGSITGPITVDAGATLSVGTAGSPVFGSIAVDGDLRLSGTTLLRLNKDGAVSDRITCTGTVTFGGTLIVTNAGVTALAAGDRFQLFQGSPCSGFFAVTNLPSLGADLKWDTSGLANGYLSVVAVTPAPVITGPLVPDYGRTNGGTLVTINGAGFVDGVTVQFGPSVVPMVSFINSTQLKVVTPAHPAGAVPVTVQNPDRQTGSLGSGFSFVLPPSPAMLSSSERSGSNLVLVWAGGANESCALLSATNVAQALGTWTPVATNLVGANGLSTNALPISPAEPQRFYLLSIPYN